MARISQLLLIRKVKFASFAIQCRPTISNSTKLHFNSTKILLQPYIRYTTLTLVIQQEIYYGSRINSFITRNRDDYDHRIPVIGCSIYRGCKRIFVELKCSFVELRICLYLHWKS